MYILLGDRIVLSLPTKQKKQSVWLLISVLISSNVFSTTAMIISGLENPYRGKGSERKSGVEQ